MQLVAGFLLMRDLYKNKRKLIIVATTLGSTIILLIFTIVKSVNQIRSTNISIFSGIGPEEASRVLPFVSINLTAERTTQGVLLKWFTEDKPQGEHYNYFTIERSLQNDPWKREKLMRVKIIMDYAGPYEYLDTNDAAGSSYSYRIKATKVRDDFVGTAGLSNSVEIIFPEVRKKLH